jgi:hypothetical protein
MKSEYELPGQRTRITSTGTSSSTIRLTRPVEVIVRTKEECVGDPQLERFSVTDGPAAAECQGIITNLISGKAVPQTVAFVKEQGTGTLLGLTSVRMGGNKESRQNPFCPEWLKKLSHNPYVGLLCRDDRYRNCELLDGTRLSTILVRAGIELVTPVGTKPPTMFAFVKRDNRGSLKAFGHFAFHPHARSAESAQEVLVRRAGKPLPPAPDPNAFRPVCVTEHPLAA